ncbi:uncharacterized protein PG986_009357 [Apiospora aurea]|uniref:Uncharacterized protein n=1 Tax=Apiospora aurea TaxID=335848 RepID=A0ABR1Q7F0_9PEZI
MARLKYRAEHFAEHGELPKAEHGLAKAMDWWIDRVVENINVEASLTSDHLDLGPAKRDFYGLISHYHTQIAMSPFTVFHHRTGIPAYRSWLNSPELKGFPRPFGIPPPRITKRGEAYWVAMRQSSKEVADGLEPLSIEKDKTAEATASPKNRSALEAETTAELDNI